MARKRQLLINDDNFHDIFLILFLSEHRVDLHLGE